MKRVALIAAMTLAVAGDGLAGSVSEVIADQKAAHDAPPRDSRLTADMEATLKKAGFTDLNIMANSILVRAKDKTGRPVAMVLHPGSMTEVVTLDPHSGSAAAGDGTKRPLTGQSTFTTVLPSARLATNFIGLSVRNAEGQTIGKIKDLAIDHDGISAYIVGIGGLDDARYVAVAPKAVEIGYDAAANAYSARMRVTSDQLKAAPAFKYEGSFKAGSR